MGVLNSIEIEEMNNRWKHAGGHIADSFTITSKWLPTAFETQLKEIPLLQFMGGLINYTITSELGLWNQTQQFINFTQCSFNLLSYHIQINRARTELQLGNYHTWMKYFKGLDNDGVWFQVEGNEIECEDGWCTGRFEAYRVEKIVEMCKLVVMPLNIKK